MYMYTYIHTYIHTFNCLLRRRWKKTSKFRVPGFYVGNSPLTGEFPAQKASYAEAVSIWWRHHDVLLIHWGRYKMSAIFQITFQMHVLEWKCMNFDSDFSEFFPKGQINNIQALVQIMAWRLLGDKLLSGPMMVSFLTYKCVPRPQLVDEK